MTSEDVTWFQTSTRHRFGKALESFSLGYVNGITPTIHLSHIAVDRWYRGRGIGSAVMWGLVAFADLHGATITLTAAHRRGLLDWYRKFGFYRPYTERYDRNMRRPAQMVTPGKRRRSAAN